MPYCTINMQDLPMPRTRQVVSPLLTTLMVVVFRLVTYYASWYLEGLVQQIWLLNGNWKGMAMADLVT